MEEKMLPDPSFYHIAELSAEEVHKNILRCHHLRHRVDRKLLAWLYIFIDRGMFKTIHKSDPVLYVMDFLKYHSTEAGEVVRVAKVLPFLPKLAETFEKGEICWYHVKLISSVAKEESEAEWLEFRRTHKAGALRAEVKSAIEKGRTRPRKGTRGIPNTTVDLKFRFTLEEMELARQALELTASEMMKSGDGKRPTPEQVLLYLAKRVLESDLVLKSGEGSGKQRSIWQVIYHKCLTTNQCCIHTRDGLVEVDPESVEKIEGEAEKVVIEPHDLVKGEVLPPGTVNKEPVPAHIEKKAFARHQNCCVICGRRGDLHLHHIVFRSKGGGNELLNLAPACPACHAQIHEGTVEIFCDLLGNLYFRTKADRIRDLLKEEIEEFAAVAPAVVVVKAASGPSPQPLVPPASLPAPALDPALERECLFVIAALAKLGHRKNDACELVRESLKQLGNLGRAPTGNELFNTAVRLGAGGIKGYGSRTCGNPPENPELPPPRSS